MCPLKKAAELERDIAIEESAKARAHEKSMGEHYDIVTEQVENIFRERLEVARNRASGLGSVTGGADDNTTGMDDTDSYTSAVFIDKQQVKEPDERQEDENADEEIDQGPIRAGRRRAIIGNAHKSLSVDTNIPTALKKAAAATAAQSKTTKPTGQKPVAPNTNTDHRDLRVEPAIARLVRPSGEGKPQVVSQKRRKQAALPSPNYLLNAAQKASKAEVAHSRGIVTGDVDSQEADPDTIVVEVPATKFKKGKEKAVEENGSFIPDDSESDGSVVILGSRSKTSKLPTARNKRRAHDIPEEDDSAADEDDGSDYSNDEKTPTADEDDGSNYSDDEKTPAAKHQKVDKKGSYIAMPLDHSHRTIASTAASIAIVVELCLFQPDRNNTYSLKRVYEIPPLMAGHERELRDAVEEFGRDDKVLLEGRRFVYGSQLMIKTPSGVWRALANPADYRSHVRSYRNKVQTAVAKGGRQDDVEVELPMHGISRARFEASQRGFRQCDLTNWIFVVGCSDLKLAKVCVVRKGVFLYLSWCATWTLGIIQARVSVSCGA